MKYQWRDYRVYHPKNRVYWPLCGMGQDFPVPKREVSMEESLLGLKPLNRHMNVSLRLRVISRTFIR